MDRLNVLLIVVAAASVIGIAAIYYRDKLMALITTKETFADADYNTYQMKPMERLINIFIASAALMAVGYVFYRNLAMAALLTPISLYYPKIRRAQIIHKRKNELKLQFKDALQSLSSSLYAGRSFESALKGAVDDLLIQYEPDSYIVQELTIIIRKLEANGTVENAFLEFAVRAHIEEIQTFAEVLDICKRTGGNLIMAIKSSADIISDKIEVYSEIQSILASKKLEQRILSVMPIAMVLMLSVSAMDFMMPVFTQAVGRIVMTISMAMFAAAYLISEKITNIEV
ncbi:MAG: Type secretion system domain [Clostridia bacterium]|jgi:tight adherence protein B|nr:Type secretion system domain [Clostridia bacterium]